MFNFNSCIICGDSIPDPVCRSCYIKQINILLNDFKIHPLAIKIILNGIKNKYPIETLNDTECILCNKGNVSICRYCFSVIFIRILRELNFSEDLIGDFGFNPLCDKISSEHECALKI